MFWVGEPSGPENKNIPNDSSYWDDYWQRHFGGVDDPENRDGYHPAKFTPKQNPFYFALPYGEIDDSGEIKPTAEAHVPWFDDWQANGGELLKNRWIKITYKRKTCYAQWQDVGPLGEDDWEWVFGKADLPKSKFNNHAGLDLSPSCWDYLGIEDNDWTSWGFVDEADVPNGPWKEIVTTT